MADQLSSCPNPPPAIDPSDSDSASASPAAEDSPALARSPSQSTSPSRLNARAPEFVPRSTAPNSPSPIQPASAASSTSGSPAMQVFTPPPSPPPFYAPGKEPYGTAAVVLGEAEAGNAAVDRDPGLDGLSDDVIQKTARQVEYYFSDLNLATTDHLMRFITKDPEGFVPMSVALSFRKIKGLVSNSAQLAIVLRTSSKLVVSDDGKKVRRKDRFTESDLQAVQARILVAGNLPEDHTYQNLMRIFSASASVNTIRTCYPQTPNGTPSPSNRATTSKLDMLFGNRLHAFVEFETAEDAEKALAELSVSDEHNWRSGLRLRLLSKCLNNHAQSRGRKGNENDMTGEEDASTSNQSPNERQADELLPPTEATNDNLVDESCIDKDGALKQGRGRGRGGRGRGRAQHYNNNRGSSSLRIGSPSPEAAAANKLPPGPRMPDGTRGFAMGRGKAVAAISSD